MTDIYLTATRAMQEAMYCAAKDAPDCQKLCANADLVGIGVRIAFYLQAFTTASLVIKSPQDSPQGMWSATILTAALIIPAMISKFKGNLTLHHAHMVMNFATLSTVTSLSVAPVCAVWRKGSRDAKDPPRPLTRLERYRKMEPTRGRMVLATALFFQIILQWAWTITLFVHPFYSQPECSASTTLVLGIFVLKAEELDGHSFALWAGWLMFSLAVTLIWGIRMVISSSDEVHDVPVERHITNELPAPRPSNQQDHWLFYQRPWVSQLSMSIKAKKRNTTGWLVGVIVPPDDEYLRKRLEKRLSNVAAFFVVTMYLIVSELQMAINSVFEGENDLSGFSQVAALLLAISPAWTLAVVVFNPSVPERRMLYSRTNSTRSSILPTILVSSYAETYQITSNAPDNPPDENLLMVPSLPPPWQPESLVLAACDTTHTASEESRWQPPFGSRGVTEP